MVIFRIVTVSSFTNELHQEVAIDSLVVVEWHKVQIVQAKSSANKKDSDDAECPDTIGNVVFNGDFLRAARDLTLDRMTLSAIPLT